METSEIPLNSCIMEKCCIICYESKRNNIFELNCCGKELCTSCHLRILKSSLENSCPNCRTIFNKELQGDESQTLISISPSNVVISFRDIEILNLIQGLLLLWYFYENIGTVKDLAIGITMEFIFFLIYPLLMNATNTPKYKKISDLLVQIKVGEGYLSLFYFWLKMMQANVNIGVIFCLCWFLSHDDERKTSSWKVFHMPVS